MGRTIQRIPSYIQTYTGLVIEPLDLQPEDILLEDIAHHLSNQCRWSGATRHHYSVAQHTWYASFQVPPEQAYDALHHDDAEYVLQDMAKPLKNHVTLGKAYRGAEARIERVIGPTLGVRFPISPEVHEADLLVLCAEADQIMHGRSNWKGYPDELRLHAAADITIVKWTPEKAERKWLARHEKLKEEKDAATIAG